MEFWKSSRIADSGKFSTASIIPDNIPCPPRQYDSVMDFLSSAWVSSATCPKNVVRNRLSHEVPGTGASEVVSNVVHGHTARVVPVVPVVPAVAAVEAVPEQEPAAQPPVSKPSTRLKSLGAFIFPRTSSLTRSLKRPEFIAKSGPIDMTRLRLRYTSKREGTEKEVTFQQAIDQGITIKSIMKRLNSTPADFREGGDRHRMLYVYLSAWPDWSSLGYDNDIILD